MNPAPPVDRERSGADRLKALLDHLSATLTTEREAEIEDLHRRALSWEPVERLPLVMDYMLKKFYYAQPVPDEIVAAWHKLVEVSIQGSTLKLKMP